MKKSIIVFVMLTGIVVAGRAALIVNEQFNYTDGSDIESVSSWTGTGAGTVSNGILSMTGNLELAFDQTYTVDPNESGADNSVSELWFKTTVNLTGGASIRPGLGSTSSTIEVSKYATAHMTMSGGSLVTFRAWSQNWYSNAATVPNYDGSDFVAVYGKLSDSSGSLKVEIWFNPADPENLGSADVSYTRAYVDSKIVDRIDLGNWGGAVSIDNFVVGTAIGDVIPEPSTVGLFALSGVGCLLMRNFIRM